ncbi:hypothetical protein HOK51_03340 [Candidatus Woesearchaeota archaeon]|mgnify:CR=1 FL=1|jgi:hypothetical protein|nr:hypothetical protein [Candidatus Woesearchaeota archaeon]MBT6518854.1 hypothetical protein [Candidatus Woesearchaeota archaeon]MBT7367993.1 hypothetical protein [Candidatus Woesearchaeota archaeon]
MKNQNSESYDNRKRQAETMYANAVFAVKNYRFEQAIDFGKQAVEFYEKLNIQTLEDAIATQISINNVPIPELMHEGVVKARLKVHGLNLD